MTQLPPPPPPPGGAPPPPPPGGGYPAPGMPMGAPAPAPAPAPAAAPAPAPAAGGDGAGVTLTADQLKGMFSSQAASSPVSMGAKAIFLIGLMVYGLCTFMVDWKYQGAMSDLAEMKAIKRKMAKEIGPRPGEPGRPPNYERYKLVWTVEDDPGGEETSPKTKVELPDDIKDKAKALKKKWEQANHKYQLNELKPYKKKEWEYQKKYWEEEAKKDNQRRNELGISISQKLNGSVMSTPGLFLRWLGLSLMFLGMGGLALVGKGHEPIIALLVLGIGILPRMAGGVVDLEPLQYLIK